MKHQQALAINSSGPRAVPFRGRWRNERDSEMILRVKGNAVSGRYTSRVSGEHRTVSGPIAGYINGYTIAFVVRWPTASVTAWVGQYVRERGQDVIRTFWQLTREVQPPGDARELWNAVNSGADRFVRARPRSAGSIRRDRRE